MFCTRAQYRESRPVATNDINHIRANVLVHVFTARIALSALCYAVPAMLRRTIINLSKYNFYGHGKSAVLLLLLLLLLVCLFSFSSNIFHDFA